MLVKILPILLIIIKDINSQRPSVGDQDIVLEENVCTTPGNISQELVPIKFKELVKYDTKQGNFRNVIFKEIGILHLDWDLLKNKSNFSDILCGLSVHIYGLTLNYNITYSTGYNKGHKFDDIKYPIYCNIQQCDLGLVFFDKPKTATILNDVSINHTVEHAVLMVIKSSDNKMFLGFKNHDKVNIRISLCPYIDWVSKTGLLKFIPDENVKDNGYMHENVGFAHIVVPFYKRNEESDEFICGKLKQPTMPDLLIGFKLNEKNGSIEMSEDIDPLKDELKCQSGDEIAKHFHFGYLEKDTNYMSERIMEWIGVREVNKIYKFYAGQKIYIYKAEKILEAMKNANTQLRLEKPTISRQVLCIRNLKKGIKANILPSIGSVDSIKRNESLNIFYQLIQLENLNKKYSFRCLSKVDGKNKAHMEEFYSRTAKFTIKSEEDPNIVYTSSKNEIVFLNKEIKNYGSYRCKESDAIGLFDKNFTTMDKVYYLPYEGAEMKFAESHVDDTYQSDISCSKEYESFGVIKKMTIKFGQNVGDPINIEDFSNSTDIIDIKEGKIIYKAPKDVFGVTVECIYKTPAETTFYTTKTTNIRRILDTETKNGTELNMTKENTVTHVENNSKPWIIGVVVAVVLLFCIILSIVAYFIVRRIRKRRTGDNSASSALSEVSANSNNTKGSRSMSGSKSRTKGRSKGSSKLTTSKTAKSGKGSTTASSSSNVRKNSRTAKSGKGFTTASSSSNVRKNSKTPKSDKGSTTASSASTVIMGSTSPASINRGKKFYKQVKLVAK